MTYDLIIRNGTIVDGLGGEPYVGDVAVRDGLIVVVGAEKNLVNGDTAEREIDARADEAQCRFALCLLDRRSDIGSSNPVCLFSW